MLYGAKSPVESRLQLKYILRMFYVRFSLP